MAFDAIDEIANLATLRLVLAGFVNVRRLERPDSQIGSVFGRQAVYASLLQDLLGSIQCNRRQHAYNCSTNAEH